MFVTVKKNHENTMTSMSYRLLFLGRNSGSEQFPTPFQNRQQAACIEFHTMVTPRIVPPTRITTPRKRKQAHQDLHISTR